LLLPQRIARKLDLGKHRHLWQQLHRGRCRRPVRDDHREPQHLADIFFFRLCAERHDQSQRPGRNAMRAPKRGSLTADCGGTTAVEFGLVAPIFLMFLFGSIEFGRLLWTQQALQETAIAGARCMAIAQGTTQSSPCASSGTYSASSTQSYIQSVGSGWGLSIATSDITLNKTATCGGTSGFSQVKLSNTFTTAVPQIVLLAAGGTALSATACYPNNS